MGIQDGVILLNADYTFLSVISWRDAILKMVKGKVEVLKATTKVITNFEQTVKMMIPKVLRLVKLVKSIYRDKIPFSKRNVIIRDRGICQYCGSRETNMTLDHIVPKFLGGDNSYENCVACCKPCNNRKNNRTPEQAGMRLMKHPMHPTVYEFLRIKSGVDIHNLVKDILN